MYREKKIGLVIPARNEERLLPPTLESVPDHIDRIYVVDDGSTDETVSRVKALREKDARISIIVHETCSGPGAAIITGYEASLEDDCDIVVVVGGDNQMDLSEVNRFLDPLVDDKADYTKGNRFFYPDETFDRMPTIRLVGNMIISALTKIASGYFKTVDVVDGYTAITRHAIQSIRWEIAWKGYGYPMDFLVRLNAAGMRVKDIPRTAIYLPGERQSQIKGISYAMKVAPMLLRDFFWRLFYKYAIRDFHPLIFFYLMGLTLFPLGTIYGLYLIYARFFLDGITAATAVFCALLVITGFQSLVFAMLFDMESSENRN